MSYHGRDLTKGTYPLNFVKRVRFGNIQMNHHPMHLHGHQFSVVGADGFPIAEHTQICKNTILVASGETWDISFQANNPGILPFHCHMPHHVTNNGVPGVGETKVV
ncbi:multicopper oxidase domain-containing protein [Lysinibacillus sphaericus]|uniref:multicopper oxidase domain-containing protein n=1 Tax=Lysinibacillus sphaericus TaxID=1421 RepID=UPI003CFE1478